MLDIDQAPSIVPDKATLLLIRDLAIAKREGDTDALAQAEPLFEKMPDLREIVHDIANGKTFAKIQGERSAIESSFTKSGTSPGRGNTRNVGAIRHSPVSRIQNSKLYAGTDRFAIREIPKNICVRWNVRRQSKRSTRDWH